MNNATCVDGINEYTCVCIAGFTGQDCEVNIDECEPEPCLNGGRCDDGINEYACDCDDTGFEGQHCEVNIDECAWGKCVNNATCEDAVNAYVCHCHEGYEGQDCDIDVEECGEVPCQHDGLCFERSNVSLYDPRVGAQLPPEVRPVFDREFAYGDAVGYVCSCRPGYEGEIGQIRFSARQVYL